MSLGDKLKKSTNRSKPIDWTKRPEVLLCPNIPLPMHGTAPRVILGTNWWNKTRLLAYKSTDYHCLACGVYKTDAKSRKWLEGHELYDIDYLMGRMVYVETVPLCHFCHNFIHSGRLRKLLEQGKIHQAKYSAIIIHGERVLREAKLTKPPPAMEQQPEWGEWRLVIGDKEYPPFYKSFEEYSKRWSENDD